MSSKYSPYGFPCFFTSSISFCLICASGAVCVDVTIRFPWRPVGISPGWFRPWPFDWLKFLIGIRDIDRKSTRLNSSHDQISYAVFCLKKKKKKYAQEFVQVHNRHPV